MKNRDSKNANYQPVVEPKNTDKVDTSDISITTKKPTSDGGLLKNDLVQTILTKLHLHDTEETNNMPKNNKPVDEKNKLSVIKKRQGVGVARKGSRVATFLLVFGLIFILLGSVVATYLIDIYNSADSVSVLKSKPYQSSIVYARDGKTELFKIHGEENRKYVTLDQIPKVMQYALIGLEDENFYRSETGIPWKNLIGASVKCLTGDACRGASGLSQQLVKNVTKDDESSLNRKIRELFSAIKLNQDVSHDEILELYLNQVPFGRNAYGVEMASQTYFGKSIAEVNPAEACFLAGLPQSPSAYSLGVDAKNNPDSQYYEYWETIKGRQEYCLEKLSTVKVHPEDTAAYLNNEEKKKWQETDVTFKARGADVKYPHWRDYITKELGKFVTENELETNGYTIITTIDVNLQDKIQEIINNGVDKYVLSAGANNVAAVVLDGPTGEILSMIGSRDYSNTDIDGQVNIATSPKAPGSTYKPYVYASAMNQGFSAGTVLLDSRTDFGGGYSPQNYGSNNGYGLITMRAALQRSLNISTIKTAFLSAGEGVEPNGDKSMENIRQFSKDAGLEYPTEECAIYVSAALGSCDVTMLSHATGYNTFAQEGFKHTATPFVSITMKDENNQMVDIYKKIQSGASPVYEIKQNAIDPVVAREITNVLSDNSVRTFGTAETQLVFPGYKGAVAAKTGTSTDEENRPTNLWTVGYTKYKTVAVWVGNTKDSATQKLGWNVDGVTSATPYWNSIMRLTHENLERKEFSTEGLVEKKLFCPYGTIGCKTEYLTPKQLERYNNAGNVISKSSFDQSKSSIFDFANEILERNVKVSKLDGKLVNSDSYPSGLLTDTTCYSIPTSFPSITRWSNVGASYLANRADVLKSCPTSYTDIQVTTLEAGIEFGQSFGSNSSMPSTLNITATPNIPTTSIKKITLKVSGEVVASVDGNTMEFEAYRSGISGTKAVQILIEDNIGLVTEKTYSSINFDYPATPLESSDISSLSASCNNTTAGSTTTCTVSLPVYRSFPTQGLKAYIGNSVSGGTCYTSGGGQAVCNNVGTTSLPGTYPIKLQIGSGSLVSTSSTAVVN